MTAIGIDVGGTKLLAIAVDLEDAPSSPGDINIDERVSTATPSGPTSLLALLTEVVQQLDGGGDASVGLGLPGLVDESGRFRYGPNLPGVVDIDLRAELAAATGRSVHVGNDATCATIAEFSAGAGAGHADGLLVTLGTGIGCGLFIDGRVRFGWQGFAGEPGHMVVDPAGPNCPCGRRGCWERYASGSGFARLARASVAAGRLGAALDLAGSADLLGGEHVVEAARAGDRDSHEVLDEFSWWVAAGLANLVDVLDPSIVILGGGVMNAGDLLLDRIDSSLHDQVMGSSHRSRVALVAPAFGAEAGAVGAAMLTGYA